MTAVGAVLIFPGPVPRTVGAPLCPLPKEGAQYPYYFLLPKPKAALCGAGSVGSAKGLRTYCPRLPQREQCSRCR
jgi:hypothetical protein